MRNQRRETRRNRRESIALVKKILKRAWETNWLRTVHQVSFTLLRPIPQFSPDATLRTHHFRRFLDCRLLENGLACAPFVLPFRSNSFMPASISPPLRSVGFLMLPSTYPPFIIPTN